MTQRKELPGSSWPIRTTVWGENIHERENSIVASVYPDGLHTAIANGLSKDTGILTKTVTLQDADQGCSPAILAETDVLVWWGHKAHGELSDQAVENVVRRVWSGMGLIVLHSGHFSRVFKALMGTPCSLKWREAGERERIWVVNPSHPIAKGLPENFVLEHEEMYGEPFTIPEPLETVFLSWFQGGEAFRSGVTFQRGAGKIFYFRPGHETYPTYYDGNVQQVLRNAVRWAAPVGKLIEDICEAPNIPAHQAHEPIVERGPSLHHVGEAGYR
ncbi:ThuA domain-containing protein [Mesorhizobium amorphae]|uniref:ThuA domain-containing protein n=1 Tax=Mesorhizobium amorphae TaxID=71433 RepID=UPI0011844B10|nr:ThuA domain-containing protein [Mesorhizobium amorphae]